MKIKRQNHLGQNHGQENEKEKNGFIFLPPFFCLESCSLLCALRAFAVNPVSGEPALLMGMESGMILLFPFVAF